MLEHRNKFPSSFHRRYDGSSNGSINDEQTMACARRRAFEHRFGRAVAQKRVRGSYEVNSCVRGVDAAVATAHEAAAAGGGLEHHHARLPAVSPSTTHAG